MPPMMTMLNEVTDSGEPPDGWKGRIGDTRAPAAPTQAAPIPNATAYARPTSPDHEGPYGLSAAARMPAPDRCG